MKITIWCLFAFKRNKTREEGKERYNPVPHHNKPTLNLKRGALPQLCHRKFNVYPFVAILWLTPKFT